MTNALLWLDSQPLSRKTVSVGFGNEEVFRFYERYGFYPRAITLQQTRAAGGSNPDRICGLR
jgi:diamine N-acetyltransferase